MVSLHWRAPQVRKQPLEGNLGFWRDQGALRENARRSRSALAYYARIDFLRAILLIGAVTVSECRLAIRFRAHLSTQ